MSSDRHSSSSILYDSETEDTDQSSYFLDEPLNSKKRKFLGVDRAVCCVVVIIALIVISISIFSCLVLILMAISLGGAPVSTYRDYDSNFVGFLVQNFTKYTFSQNTADGDVLEGILFMPNTDVEYTHSDDEVTYGLFETNLMDEQPVTWTCQGNCNPSDHKNRRMSTIVLPKLTFTLLSVATAAAISYYTQQIVEYGRCGEDVVVSNIDCSVEGDYFYECSATTLFNDYAVDQLHEMINDDVLKQAEFSVPNKCVLDTESYDLASAQVKAKEFFNTAKDIVNALGRARVGGATGKIFPPFGDLVVGFQYHGCKSRPVVLELSDYERCD